MSETPSDVIFGEAIREISGFSERMEFYEMGNPRDIEEDVLVESVKNTDDGLRLKSTYVQGLIVCVESSEKGNNSGAVDLAKKTHSFKLFQDFTHMNMRETKAAIMARIDIGSLTIDERRIGSLREVNERGIIPSDIETVAPEDLQPPTFKRQRGRSRTRLIRRLVGDPKKVNFCSLPRCHERGSNKRTCPLNVN